MPTTHKCYLSNQVCEEETCKGCKYMDYNLFLDDVRMPKQVSGVDLPLVEWQIVRNFEQFTTYIKLHGVPARVSFDHDLGPMHYIFDWAGNDTCPGQLSGYDCVKWLVQYCQEHNHKFPDYTLHTLNDVGKNNMESYIQAYLKKETEHGPGRTDA